MTWELKSLRYGGTCSTCGSAIARRAIGWHNAELKKVRCVNCQPVLGKSDDELIPVGQLRPDPVGGTAALREAQSRKDPLWMKGAAGEYLLDTSLHKRLSPDAVILTDRRVPGTNKNIDHVVIASSGVWVIDSKNWRGSIEFKAPSRTSPTYRLFVGGSDRTTHVEAIYGLIIPVAQEIGDRSVPVNGALVFIDGEWSNSASCRLALRKPYFIREVMVTAPRLLSDVINRKGPLGPTSVSEIASKLDRVLTPR